MRAVIHAFDTLKMETDDILQFFVWRAMPYALQTQLVNITNNSKPSVKEN